MSTKNNSNSAVSTKNQVLDMTIPLEEGVNAKFQGDKLTIQGPLGRVEQDFSKIPIEVKIEGKNIKLISRGARRKNRSIFNTARSLIANAVHGVTKGYQYKLKVIFAHFPVSVKVQGKNILVENFYGERSPRVAEIIGDTKAEVQGEDIILNGVSIQDVGQTAANLEQATTVRRKDQRVFLDGVYVYERTSK